MIGRTSFLLLALLLVAAHPSPHQEGAQRLMADRSPAPADTISYVSPTPSEEGEFGVAMASVGDLDGDGISDLLIGAPNEVVQGKEKVGRAYLYSGRDTSLLRTLTAPVAKEGMTFGGAVTGVGDVTGDDIPDVVVGASGPDNAGRAYLIGGDQGEVLYTIRSPNATSDGYFAVSSLSRVEDVDRDGHADLIAGAYGENRAYLFSGAKGQLLQTLSSPNEGGFGNSVAGIGDVDGDGVTDLLVGAPLQTVDSMRAAGAAALFSGDDGELIQILNSPDAGAKKVFGYTVASIGDLDEDDVPDYAIFSRFGGAKRAGVVYLYSGATGDVFRTLTSPNAERTGLFGYAVTGVGNVVGTQTPDLVLTGRNEQVGEMDGAGRVYLIDGKTGNVVRTMTSPHVEEKGQLGRSLAVVQNVNTGEAQAVVAGAYQESVRDISKAGRAHRFPIR